MDEQINQSKPNQISVNTHINRQEGLSGPALYNAKHH